MDYIEIESISPENIMHLAAKGIKDFKSLQANPNLEYGDVATWRMNYYNVFEYIHLLKKRSQKRVKKLHLDRTRKDVITQYNDNASIFDEFIQTALSAGPLLFKLMGLDGEEGLVPVVPKGLRLPFTYETHKMLVRDGRTSISNLGEMVTKKDRRLNARNMKTKLYAIMASSYYNVDGEQLFIPEDDRPEVPLEFLGETNNKTKHRGFRGRQTYSIRAKWLQKLYTHRGSSKFYLLHNMETQENQAFYQRIKFAHVLSRYRSPRKAQ